MGFGTVAVVSSLLAAALDSRLGAATINAVVTIYHSENANETVHVYLQQNSAGCAFEGNSADFCAGPGDPNPKIFYQGVYCEDGHNQGYVAFYGDACTLDTAISSGCPVDWTALTVYGPGGGSPPSVTNNVWTVTVTNRQSDTWWRLLTTNGTPLGGWVYTGYGETATLWATSPPSLGAPVAYGSMPGIDGYQVAAASLYTNETAIGVMVSNATWTATSLGSYTNMGPGSGAVQATNSGQRVDFWSGGQQGSTNPASGADVRQSAAAIINAGTQASAETKAQATRSAAAGEAVSNILQRSEQTGTNLLDRIADGVEASSNRLNQIAGSLTNGAGQQYTNWQTMSNEAWTAAESTGWRSRMAASQATNLAPSGTSGTESHLVWTISEQLGWEVDFRPSQWPSWLTWGCELAKNLIGWGILAAFAWWVRDQVQEAYDASSLKVAIASSAPAPQSVVGTATWAIKKGVLIVTAFAAILLVPAMLIRILEQLGLPTLTWFPDLIATAAGETSGGADAAGAVRDAMLIVDRIIPWASMMTVFATALTVWVTRGMMCLVFDSVALKLLGSIAILAAGTVCQAAEIRMENLSGTNLVWSNASGGVVVVPPGRSDLTMAEGEWTGSSTVSVAGARGAWRSWQGGSDYYALPTFGDGFTRGMGLGFGIAGTVWVFCAVRRVMRQDRTLSGD